MAPETRSKGNPPPSRIYHSSPALHQVHFPAHQRLVRTHGRRTVSTTRSLHQQTLTQMEFVPRGDGGGEGEAWEGIEDSQAEFVPVKTTSKMARTTAAKKGATAAAARKRRRKTTGDEADGGDGIGDGEGGDEEEGGHGTRSRRFQTQTITQALRAPSRAASAASSAVPAVQKENARVRKEAVTVIEDSEAEADSGSGSDEDLDGDRQLGMTPRRRRPTNIEEAARSSGSGRKGRRIWGGDGSSTKKEDRSPTKLEAIPLNMDGSAAKKDSSSFARLEGSATKRDSGSADLHTPSTKRQRFEVPSSVPSIGSPLSPMIKRFSPLGVKASPLKRKSGPAVAFSPARPVNLKALPAGLMRSKLGDGGKKTKSAAGSSVGRGARNHEIPDSEADDGLESDDDEIVGEDLVALEARVLGPPKKAPSPGAAAAHLAPDKAEFVIFTDVEEEEDDDEEVEGQEDDGRADKNGDAPMADGEDEPTALDDSETESGAEDKENANALETYAVGAETQAVLEQVLSRSERQSAPGSNRVWTRRLAKHAPPVQFQTQMAIESQRVPLDQLQGMDPPNRRSDLWVAMRPETVAQVVSGAKTHEFRSWLNPEVRRFWIYESRPTCEVRYMADVGPARRPGELDDARGVGNKDFNARRGGAAPFAHELVQVYELNDPVPLSDMIECGWVDAAPERPNEYVPPAIVARLLANLRWALFAEGGEGEDEDEEEQGDDGMENYTENGGEANAVLVEDSDATLTDVENSNLLPSSPPTLTTSHPATQQLRREQRVALMTSSIPDHEPRRVLGELPAGPAAAAAAQQQQQNQNQNHIPPHLGPGDPRRTSAPPQQLWRPPALPPPRTPTAHRTKKTTAAAINILSTPIRDLIRQSQISTSSGSSARGTPTPTPRGKAAAAAARRRADEGVDDGDANVVPSPTPRRPRRPAQDSNSTILSTGAMHGLVCCSSDQVGDGGASGEGVVVALSSSQRLPDSLLRDDGREPPAVVWDSQGEEDDEDDEDDEGF